MAFMREALMQLAAAVEPGDAVVGRLLTDYTPEELIRKTTLLSAGVAQRLRECDLAQLVRDTEKCRATFLTAADEDWPEGFATLGVLGPLGIWVRGDRQALTLRAMSIVGSRTSTIYGEETAMSFASAFAARGMAVVSGGAFGIDAAAHRGALAVGGSTIVILAGGVDQPYPRAHSSLFEKVEHQGCLVSESPPGTLPMRHRFLVRNRMIAAWSRGTIVVEARVRSGAIATASHAVALGRDVMAVPGPITSAASTGCHALIRDGAVLVTSPDEAIELVFGDLLHSRD